MDSGKLFGHNHNKKGRDYDALMEQWGAETGKVYKLLLGKGDKYKLESLQTRIEYYLKRKPSFRKAFEESSGIDVKDLKFRF